MKADSNPSLEDFCWGLETLGTALYSPSHPSGSCAEA